MRTPLLALLLAASAPAQVTLVGTVVRQATGEPLAGVRVVAPCMTHGYHGATDAAGQYRVTGVAAPRCSLLLDGPGILPRLQEVTIGKQDTFIALRIPMRRQAVISSRVLDEKGWPIARASVIAVQYGTKFGSRGLEPAARTQTDDLGAYRLAKLAPGRYYIRVRPQATPPTQDYLAIWYPAAALFENARAIDLAEG